MTIYQTNYDSKMIQEHNKSITSERAKETAELYDSGKRALFEKLENGSKIEVADLVFVPAIKPVNYEQLKKKSPAQYVKYYDETKGCLTAAGLIHELELINKLNSQENAPLNQRIIAGSNQYKFLASIDMDIVKTGKGCYLDGCKVCPLTTAQQIKVRALLKEIFENAYIPQIRTHSPELNIYNPEK